MKRIMAVASLLAFMLAACSTGGGPSPFAAPPSPSPLQAGCTEASLKLVAAIEAGVKDGYSIDDAQYVKASGNEFYLVAARVDSSSDDSSSGDAAGAPDSTEIGVWLTDGTTDPHTIATANSIAREATNWAAATVPSPAPIPSPSPSPSPGASPAPTTTTTTTLPDGLSASRQDVQTAISCLDNAESDDFESSPTPTPTPTRTPTLGS